MKKLFPLFALFILACSNNNSEQIVNMYSQRHYDVDQLQYDNFEKITGIKVNVIKANADELIQRMKNEGENSPADLFITVDVGKLWQASDMDLLQKYNDESLTYGITGQGHLGASLGQINGGQIPNSEITPFQKNETEFGFDFRMFDNKVSLDATFYDNETVGDIVGVSASATSGFGSALANLGKISNKGIELLLRVKPVVTDDFAMEVSFNYTNNDSEVVATNDTDGNISLDEPRERTLRVTHIVGEKYGALFGTYFNRDDQGRIIHEMSQGYPRPSLNTSRKILGFGVPPQQLGIGASFRYKDWNASFLVEGKSGAQVFSGTNVRLIGYGLHQMTVPAGGREAGFIPDGVLEDGTPITQSLDMTQQQNYWGRYNDVAEAGIYDSDYFRMRQMSIGYTFPKSMLEGTFIQSASVSLIGKNLFFITNSVDNVDPESAYNSNNSQGLEFAGMPVPSTVGINVNLKF